VWKLTEVGTEIEERPLDGLPVRRKAGTKRYLLFVQMGYRDNLLVTLN
jgi:hypothetical protein